MWCASSKPWREDIKPLNENTAHYKGKSR